MKEEQRQLCQGDIVRIKGQERLGEVAQLDNKRAIVVFDAIRISIPLSQLEQVQAESIHYSPTTTRVLNMDAQAYCCFNTEIDLHGMQVATALQVVEKWVDQAALLGHKHLKIIHGKGTGVLRQAVRNYLKAHQQVKEIGKDNFPYSGGTGVTAVVLV